MCLQFCVRSNSEGTASCDIASVVLSAEAKVLKLFEILRGFLLVKSIMRLIMEAYHVGMIA